MSLLAVCGDPAGDRHDSAPSPHLRVLSYPHRLLRRGARAAIALRFVLLALCSGPGIAQAACSDYGGTPRLVYRIPTWNPGYDIVVQDDIAYWIGSWTGAPPLRVFDIANPEHPMKIQESWLEMDAGTGAISEGRLYITGYSYSLVQGGIQVLDLPGLSTFALGYLSPQRVRDLSVDGDLVRFITQSTFGVAQVASGSLSLVGSVALGASAWSMTMAGSIAFVAARTSGLVVVDAGVPAAPQVITTLPLPGVAWMTELRGNVAYIAAGAAGLIIVDITNPSAPFVLGQLSGIGDVRAIHLDGSTAFLSGGDDMVLVDVTDPAMPVRVRGFGMPASLDFAVHSDYILNPAMGLNVYRHGDPHEVATLGSVALPVTSAEIAVAGDRAAVVTWDSLEVVAFADPAAPVRIGSTGLWFDPGVIASRAGRAYVLSISNDPIRVFDLAGPGAPTVVDSFIVASGLLADLDIDGDLGYGWYPTGANSSDLVLLDLSLPGNPPVLASVPIPHQPDAIAHDGMRMSAIDRVYAGGISSVHMILADLTPGSPQLLADLALDLDYGTDVAMQGNWLYLSGDSNPDQMSYLASFDISNPEAPILRDCQNTASGSLSLAGDQLYVAGSANGVYAFDLAAPEHPGLIGAWNTPGLAQRVVATDQLLVCLTDRGVAIGPTACDVEALPPGLSPALLSGRAAPNPTGGITRLHFATPARTDSRLQIFDALGRLLRTMRLRPDCEAAVVWEWDGRDGAGRTLPSGVYRAVLRSGGTRETISVVKIR